MSKIDVILDISNQNLSALPKYVLEMSNLKMLYLENNNIEVLPEELFTKLKKLVWLDLRRNKLKTIPQTIKNHENLETLLLRDNEIAVLPSELGLLPNLKVLQISGNPLVYPKKEIIQEGVKTIMEYLKKQYEAAKELTPGQENVAPSPEIKLTVSQKDENFENLQNEEQIAKFKPNLKTKNCKRDSKCTLTLKTKAKKTVSKNASVYKDYPFRGTKNPNLKVYQNTEEKQFKELWMQKFKDIMNGQDYEIQKEKDSEMLKNWRQKTLKQSNKARGEPPFDISEEYMRLPSRKDLRNKDYKRDDRPQRICKMQPKTKIRDVDKFITDIVESLQHIGKEKNMEISPRSQMEKAGRDIRKIVDLQKRLSALKLAIAKDFKT